MVGKRILAVDDERHMLRLLEYNLQNCGYDVITASDGPSAIRKVKGQSPDLILLDIKMPGMSGYDVCKQLKEEPSTAKIPVIFVSVLADDEKAKTMGARAYILKPFSPSTLIKEVKEVLG